MKNILLTGGKGFIGRNIRENCGNQYNIFSPDRQELELKETKSVTGYFKKLNPDVVVNTANVGGKRNTLSSEESCFYENLIAFKNIYSSGKDAKKFIHLGSGAEYSKPFLKENMREDDAGTVIPSDAYGFSKYIMGQLLEKNEPGRHVNLRIFGIFGPHEDYQVRFISNAIVRSLLGYPIILNQNALFDYMYINDFLKVLQYFIENPAPEVSYNMTTGQPITLLELAKIVHQLTNNKHSIILKDKKLKETYTGKNDRLMKFLPPNFKFTPIEIAIKELIQWYESELSLLNKSTILDALMS